jgi:L-alanine-DL-glutamate epimerase-like enolase superfamily enzyme
MHIERLEVKRFSLRPPIPLTVAYGSYPTLDYVSLQVHTDNGLVGLGEASPDTEVTGETQDTCLHGLQRAESWLIGRDPFELEALLGAFEEEFFGQPSAMAALDMALYDLIGKALGVPVYRLLGGSARRVMEIYPLVPLLPPREMAELAAAFATGGYGTLKLKVGTGPDEDEERVRLVREAVGPEVRLRVDVNQGWHTAAVAIPAVERVARWKVDWIEQPVDAEDLDGLAEVTHAVKVPIMVDEGCHAPQDALAVVRRGAANIINIKLMKCGGLHRALQIAAIAEAAGLPCIVGSMGESSIGSLAGLHLYASRKCFLAGEVIGPLFVEGDIASGFEVLDGCAVLPAKPGLGAALFRSPASEETQPA